MLPLLVVSILTGTLSALISLMGFDAGPWAASMWYVVGSWAGFAVSLGMVLLLMNWPKPPPAKMLANLS